MLSMMCKCIMVKVGGNQKSEKKQNRGKFVHFAEIGVICNMHNWLMGIDAPESE